MKVQRVEVYFVMYLAAIVSFFAADTMFREERNKLVTVLEELVSLDQLPFRFELAQKGEENGEAHQFLLVPNDRYRRTHDMEVTWYLVDSDNDSIQMETNIAFALGDSVKEIVVEKGALLNDKTYRLYCDVPQGAKLVVSDEGSDYLSQTLGRSELNPSTIKKLSEDIVEKLNDRFTVQSFKRIPADYQIKKGSVIIDPQPMSTSDPIIDGIVSVYPDRPGQTVEFTTSLKAATAQKLVFSVSADGRQIPLELLSVQDGKISFKLNEGLAKNKNGYPVMCSDSKVRTRDARIISAELGIQLEYNTLYVGDDVVATAIGPPPMRRGASIAVIVDDQQVYLGQPDDDPIRYSTEAVGQGRVELRKDGSVLATAEFQVKPPKPPRIVDWRPIEDNKSISVEIKFYGVKNTIEVIPGEGLIGDIESKRATGSETRYRVEYRIRPIPGRDRIAVELIVKDKYGRSDKLSQTIDLRN